MAQNKIKSYFLNRDSQTGAPSFVVKVMGLEIDKITNPGEKVRIEKIYYQNRDAIMPRGRPKTANPKRQVTLRLDADILEAYKATGKGYQTRINADLREAVKEMRDE